MKYRFLFFILLLTLIELLCCGPATAAASDERRALQQSRQEVEARFKRESLTCQQQFQVNSCMAGLRAERIAKLTPIQAREDELAALERKARAEAQAQRVAERQREFAAEEGRRRTQALQPEPVAPRKGSANQNPPVAHAPPVDPEVHAKSITRQQNEAAEAAARGREQASKRQRLVLQHQQDFQRRQEEREASGRKPGEPLPVPSTSDIAKAASAASAAKH